MNQKLCKEKLEFSLEAGGERFFLHGLELSAEFSNFVKSQPGLTVETGKIAIDAFLPLGSKSRQIHPEVNGAS